MKSSVIVFPGSNCDRDISVALEKLQFNFDQQLIGPLVFSYFTYLNLDSNDSNYGKFIKPKSIKLSSNCSKFISVVCLILKTDFLSNIYSKDPGGTNEPLDLLKYDLILAVVRVELLVAHSIITRTP